MGDEKGGRVHLCAKFICVILTVGGLILNKHSADRKDFEIGQKKCKYCLVDRYSQ